MLAPVVAVKAPSGPERCTSKPVSLFVLSCQVRSTWLGDTGVEVRLDGAFKPAVPPAASLTWSASGASGRPSLQPPTRMVAQTTGKSRAIPERMDRLPILCE
jgi:hypothetical protein